MNSTNDLLLMVETLDSNDFFILSLCCENMFHLTDEEKLLVSTWRPLFFFFYCKQLRDVSILNTQCLFQS